ncbi:hypothetical protein [Oceanithermus sp.]
MKKRLIVFGLLALSIAFVLSSCGLISLPGVEGGIEINIPAGGSVTQDVTVTLPDPSSGSLGADVMWLVDLSGSFDDNLETWQNQTKDIESALKAVIPNLHVGLSSFVDAPCSDFGYPGDDYDPSDYGYKLNLALTDNFSEFENAVDGLSIYYGGDEPEAQLEAMYQAVTGDGYEVSSGCSGASIPATEPGWSTDRLKFLLVSTDASFHRPTDVGSDGVSYPYPATVEDVINTANDNGVTIFFFNSGSIDTAASDIASQTSGAVFDVGGDSTGLIDAISEAAGGAITDAEVMLVPVDDRGMVSNITPASIKVDLTSTREIKFTVTFTDAGISSGSVDFKLVVKINGSVVDEIPVRVNVGG